MSKEMWSQLNKFSDGDSLNAETLNIPIGQLGDRTDYLYARLKQLISSDLMSSVVITGVKLHEYPDDEMSIGNVVYLHQLEFDNEFVAEKAKATMSLYDDFKAADSAFSVGLLQSRDGDRGNIIVYGLQNLNPGGSQYLRSSMIESGEEFRPGRYYLSANESGRLTANPTGPLIYVCSIWGKANDGGGFDGKAMVSPQFLDIGTSHIHRTAVLTARPAGTKSTAGYLPVDDSGPFALRFGGTWTADNKINYRFYISQPSAAWPDGVVLKWKENDGPENSVSIPAPDAEVRISNGLTARLSIAGSGSTMAYIGVDDNNKRVWSPLVFPDSGKGWLDHEAHAVADGPGYDGQPRLRVAVRGRFEASPIAVNIMFPENIDIYRLRSIGNGTTFAYGDDVYEFTADTVAYSGDNIALPLGTCLADSALNLAAALDGSRYVLSESSSPSYEGERFAVFEADSGDSAWLMIMDGRSISIGGESGAMDAPDSEEGGGFDVVGAENIKAMVVFDGNNRILSDDKVVKGLSSYSWNAISDKLSVMVYQDVGEVVTVSAGTIVTATAVDDEPDAAYDYVIGMDPQIANYWPPVPPKSAALMVNGVEMDNKALVPDSPTVSFGRETLHWFEDDKGRKPWPETLKSRYDEDIDPSEDKTEIMHWVRGFQGATGPVTSIQPKPGSPLKIYGYGTFDGANTGDLEIDADFDFNIENRGAPGYNVPKRAVNGKLIAGPVVERIIGGAGIIAISEAGCPEGQGTVIVALDNGSYRSQFSDIALENAEQAKIGMFPYIRLKGYSGSSISSPSAFTATMRVPTNLPDGKYALRVFASVFGEEGFSGTIMNACVKLSYSILPDYYGDMKYRNLRTSLLKPDSERTVLIPFGHEDPDSGIIYDGFDPVYVTTDDPGLANSDDVVAKVLGGNIPMASEFALQRVTPELRPGYLVGIRISRAVTQAQDVEPYKGAIGFINLSWVLVSADDYWRSASTSPVNPLDGVEIRANTAAGMRNAVETIGEALGATVVSSRSRR